MNNYIQEATNEIYRIFDILNKEYFNSSLKSPIITFQKTRKTNYGHFTLDKVWIENREENQKNEVDSEDINNNDNTSFYEININPMFLNRSTNEIVGTLLHEMVHYYNKVNEIKDCSGNIHNKKFKNEAERVGLIVEKGKSVGWGYTSNTDKLNDFIVNNIEPNADKFKLYYSMPKKLGLKKKNVFKYECPSCGIKVRGKDGLSITCTECGVEMEEQMF